MATYKQKVEYQIGVSANTQQAEKSLKALSKQLSNIADFSNSKFKSLFGDDFSQNFKEGEKRVTEMKNSLQQLSSALNSSLDVNGNLQMSKFMSNLGGDVTQVTKDVSALGPIGKQALLTLSNEALRLQTVVKETHPILKKMGETLANTIRWQISTKVLTSFTGSIQQAYGYTKNLDSSLNDIRIVTQKSADEMNRFAKSANTAAQQLGSATTEYTNASLIYYQQGLGDREVAQRTETTIKAANVTGQSAQEVSEGLTALWNGFQVDIANTESYVDKLAAVAANSASDLEELTTAMSKVAATANTTGVDVDQLTAQIATIVSVTRQAPESVGTALKTIYARMGDLVIDGQDEDGVALGTVSSQLEELGIHILDTNGDLRNMGEVVEEVGEKWQSWTSAQQQAVAIAIAGKRQYTMLNALFSNWEMYNEQLNTAVNAEGTLQEQQDIYLDSVEAHLQKLETAKEALYGEVLDSDSLSNVVDLLTELVKQVENFVKVLGGGAPLLRTIGAIGLSLAQPVITKGLTTYINNLRLTRMESENSAAATQYLSQATEALIERLQSNKDVANSGVAFMTEYYQKAQELKNQFSQGLISKEYYESATQELGLLNDVFGQVLSSQDKVIDKFKGLEQQRAGFLDIARDASESYRGLSESQRNEVDDIGFSASKVKEEVDNFLTETGNQGKRVQQAINELAQKEGTYINAMVKAYKAPIERHIKENIQPTLDVAVKEYEDETERLAKKIEQLKEVTVFNYSDPHSLPQPIAPEIEGIAIDGDIELVTEEDLDLIEQYEKEVEEQHKKNIEWAEKERKAIDGLKAERGSALANYKSQLTRFINGNGSFEKVISAYDTFKESLGDANKEAEKTFKEFTSRETKREKILKVQANEYDEVKEAIKAKTEAEKEAADTKPIENILGEATGATVEEVTEALRKFSSELDVVAEMQANRLPNVIEKTTKGISTLGWTLQSVTNTFTSFTNLIKDPSLGGTVALITSAGMAIPQLMKAFSVFKDISTLRQKGAEIAAIEATLTDTQIAKEEILKILQTAETTEEQKQVALVGLGLTEEQAQGVVKDANLLKEQAITKEKLLQNKYAAIAIAIAAALVGTIVLAVKAYQRYTEEQERSRNAAEDNLKAIKETAELLKKSYDEAKQSVDDLTSAWEAFNSKQDALKDLTEDTEEWNKALAESNQQVYDLIAQFPELAAGLKRTSEGALTIDEDVYNDVLSQAQSKLSDEQQRQFISNIQQMQAQQTVNTKNAYEDALDRYNSQRPEQNRLSDDRIKELAQAAVESASGLQEFKTAFYGLGGSLEEYNALSQTISDSNKTLNDSINVLSEEVLKNSGKLEGLSESEKNLTLAMTDSIPEATAEGGNVTIGGGSYTLNGQTVTLENAGAKGNLEWGAYKNSAAMNNVRAVLESLGYEVSDLTFKNEKLNFTATKDGQTYSQSDFGGQNLADVMAHLDNLVTVELAKEQAESADVSTAKSVIEVIRSQGFSKELTDAINDILAGVASDEEILLLNNAIETGEITKENLDDIFNTSGADFSKLVVNSAEKFYTTLEEKANESELVEAQRRYNWATGAVEEGEQGGKENRETLSKLIKSAIEGNLDSTVYEEFKKTLEDIGKMYPDILKYQSIYNNEALQGTDLWLQNLKQIDSFIKTSQLQALVNEANNFDFSTTFTRENPLYRERTEETERQSLLGYRAELHDILLYTVDQVASTTDSLNWQIDTVRDKLNEQFRTELAKNIGVDSEEVFDYLRLYGIDIGEGTLIKQNAQGAYIQAISTDIEHGKREGITLSGVDESIVEEWPSKDNQLDEEFDEWLDRVGWREGWEHAGEQARNEIYTTFENAPDQPEIEVSMIDPKTGDFFDIYLDDVENRLLGLLNANYEIDIQIQSNIEEVFKNISDEIDKIKDATSLIGEDFIVKPENVTEVAQAFPGILENYQQLADGTIQLDKEIAQVTIARVQTEQQANAETAIQQLEQQKAVLASRKASYEAILGYIEAYRKGGGKAEEFVSNISQEADKLKASNNEVLTTQELENSNTVAQQSKEDSEIVANNWNNAYGYATSAAYNFGKMSHEAFLAGTGQSEFFNSGETLDSFINSEEFVGENAKAAEDATLKTLNKLQELSDEEFAQAEASVRQTIAAIVSAMEGIDAKEAETIARSTELSSILGNLWGGKKGEEVAEAQEEEIDRLKSINDQIETQERLLKKLEDAKSKAYGTAFVDILSQENGVLEKSNKLLEKRAKIIGDELSQQQADLSKYGFSFDEYGNVTNYYETLTKLKKQDADSYEKAKAEIDDYSNSLNNWYEVNDKISENRNKQVQNQIEASKKLLEIEKNRRDIQKSDSDFRISMSDEGDYLGRAKEQGSQMNIAQQGAQAGAKNVKFIEDQIDQYMKSGYMSVYGTDINAAMGDLKTAQKDTQDNILAMRKAYDAAMDEYLGLIDETNDALEEQASILEDTLTVIEHYAKMHEMYFGDTDSAVTARIDQARLDTQNRITQQRKAEADYWREQMDATADKSSEVYKKFEENYNEALQSMNSSMEQAMDAAATKYENTITRITLETQRALSGTTFNQLDREWELDKKIDESRYDAANRVFELEKLRYEYTKAADEASEEGQAKINALMAEQLGYLEQKENLTKYDVERSQKLLDLEKARIALEDAQNNKNSMRLKRDAAGNYSYQYVADQNAVDEAQNAYNTAQQALYNFDKESYQSNLDTQLSLTKEFNEQIKAIYEDTTLTQEEKEQEVAETRERYRTLLLQNSQQTELIRRNLTSDTTQVIKDHDNIRYTSAEKALNDTVAGFTSAKDSAIEQVALTSDKINTYIDDTSTRIGDAFQTFNDDMENAAAVGGQSFNTIKEGIDGALTSADSLLKTNEDYVQSLKVGMKEMATYITDLGKIKDSYDAINESVIKVIESVGKYLGLNPEAAVEDEKLPPKGETDKTGTGETGKTGNGETGNENEDKTIKENGSNNRKPIIKLSSDNKLQAWFPNPNGKDVYRSGDRFEIMKFIAEMLGINSQAIIDARNLRAGYYSSLAGHRYDSSVEVPERTAIVTKYKNMINAFLTGIGSQITISEDAKKHLLQFRSGGYTGAWGSEGRLGVLHEKELVLNKDDTANMLEMTKVARQYASLLNGLTQNKIASISSVNSDITSAMYGLGGAVGETYINIDASFPNANKANEIEEAFKNLTNYASQQAHLQIYKNGTNNITKTFV